MMPFKVLLLLLSLLLTTTVSSEQYKRWKPQGRFGKRENSYPEFGPEVAEYLSPAKGKR